MRPSKVLAKIRAGKVARICSSNSAAAYFPRAAAHCGYDGVWVDGEHRAWDPRQVETLLLRHRMADIDCVWRPTTIEKTPLYRLLEDGATALMIPMVNTAERARELVHAMKFPPLGERGLDGAGLDGDFYFGVTKDYPAQANRETFLVAQIETPEALENVDAIAAVPGLEVLFIGPGDLSLRLDSGAAVSDPAMLDAQKRVAAAARRHGKAWGRPVSDEASVRELVALGAQFIALGSEFWGIRQHLADCGAQFDRVLGEKLTPA